MISGLILVGELEQINPKGIVRDDNVLRDGDILFVRSNGNPALVGRSILVRLGGQKVTHSAFTIRCRLTQKGAVPLFYAYMFKTRAMRDALVGRGANISNLSQSILRDLPVPVHPQRTQKDAVEKMEAERAIIESNRRLVDIFDMKIQAKLAEVWGETVPEEGTPQ